MILEIWNLNLIFQSDTWYVLESYGAQQGHEWSHIFLVDIQADSLVNSEASH